MRKNNGLIAFAWTLVTLAFTFFSGHCQAQLAEVAEVLAPEAKASMNRVTYKAHDSFMLSALYFAGEEKSAGVLLLHDCNRNSAYYEQLITLLSNEGFHALAVDLRGFGQSISPQFNHQLIKRSAKDVITYQGELAKLTAFWPSDIRTSFDFLRERLGDDAQIGVLAAGCTASYAIGLAESIRVSSFVILTPDLNYAEKERYKNLFDIPTYFISSVHHANTFQTAKELYDWSGDKRSSFQLFKGDRYGVGLIAHKPFLNQNIAGWLLYVLR